MIHDECEWQVLSKDNDMFSVAWSCKIYQKSIHPKLIFYLVSIWTWINWRQMSTFLQANNYLSKHYGERLIHIWWARFNCVQNERLWFFWLWSTNVVCSGGWTTAFHFTHLMHYQQHSQIYSNQTWRDCHQNSQIWDR